jgi:hypothetical protein
MLAAISHKSITNDEMVHIPAGYYHLVVGNYQLNNEHPPLAEDVGRTAFTFHSTD